VQAGSAADSWISWLHELARERSLRLSLVGGSVRDLLRSGFTLISSQRFEAFGDAQLRLATPEESLLWTSAQPAHP